MATPATTTPINRRAMVEIKAPEMFQFTKQGQTISGVLISIDPVQIKDKDAIEYMVQDDRGLRSTFLGTADLNKKIHPGHIGHWLEVRYETDDSSFQKTGQSAMKVFRVQASKESNCERRTQHRIDDTRKGPCLECIARLEEQHEGRTLNVIICGGRHTTKFCLCGRQGTFLCDWKIGENKSGVSTCDKPICAKHAKEVVSGKHLCPFHQHQYESWKRRNPGKVVAVESGVQQSLFESHV
jgi:hypothetical protein